MYYIIMVAATTIFAANIWVIQAAQQGGWIPFFLSMCSYLLAALCAFAFILWRKTPLWSKTIWLYSFKPAGILLAANISLLIAIPLTTPERIGFIVGLTVVFVPILQFFLHRTSIPRLIFLSLLLALGGNILLNYSPQAPVGFRLGDLFALVTTLCYAISIIWIRDCSTLNIPAESFVFIQSTISFLGYIPIVLFTGSFQNPISQPLFPLFFLGFISFIVGNALQFIAQKNMPPVVASIILAMSSVIGLFIGVIFYGLELSLPMVAAAGLFGSASVLGAYSSR